MKQNPNIQILGNKFVKIPADKLSLFLKQGNLKENTYIS